MKQKQFPAQEGPYVVKVKPEKSTDSWQDFDALRLQISVGQDYHEGDKMAAAIEWAKPRFKTITVCVNDSLQRFNLMFESGISEETALTMSCQNGQKWLERHASILSSAQHIQIKRWHEWLQDKDFDLTYTQIQNLYQSNVSLQQAIDSNIEALWGRRQMLYPALYNQDRWALFTDMSRRYLLEEVAVFSMMFEKSRAIDAYPGTTIFAALVFQGRHVEGAPPGLGKGHFCRIDFSKNKKKTTIALEGTAASFPMAQP